MYRDCLGRGNQSFSFGRRNQSFCLGRGKQALCLGRGKQAFASFCCLLLRLYVKLAEDCLGRKTELLPASAVDIVDSKVQC